MEKQHNIVDSRLQSSERGFAVAAILQSVPTMMYVALLTLLGGFLLLVLWFHYAQVPAFIDSVLLWLSRIVLACGVTLLAIAAYQLYRVYHRVTLDVYERRIVRATSEKQVQAVERARKQNALLQAQVDAANKMQDIVTYAIEHGHNISISPKGEIQVTSYLSNLHTIAQPHDVPMLGVAPEPVNALPEKVLYEDVRSHVPAGHVLVGVGTQGVETKDKAVGACVWIVGASGTGKTSTTVLRVEERYVAGHKFLGVDPHYFKTDSLMNAVSGYAGNFLHPMARTPEETKQVLHMFIEEFNARKAGTIAKPWQPITLLVDEVNSLMDATTKEEEETAKMLPTIARICGQEARNFEMGGIFISQQATQLAWLRKVSLMILVHQLLMESEKSLALNGDREAMNAMKSWPIGRTYVYGVGFTDGPRIVQQPYFAPTATAQQWQRPLTVVEASPVTEALPVSDEWERAIAAHKNGVSGPRAMQRAIGCTYYRAQQLCIELETK